MLWFHCRCSHCCCWIVVMKRWSFVLVWVVRCCWWVGFWEGSMIFFDFRVNFFLNPVQQIFEASVAAVFGGKDVTNGWCDLRSTPMNCTLNVATIKRQVEQCIVWISSMEDTSDTRNNYPNYHSPSINWRKRINTHNRTTENTPINEYGVLNDETFLFHILEKKQRDSNYLISAGP